jgi:hypothetical protein
MAKKQTLKSWASSQVHKPNDKISNFDKLKAPFIINEYITWGDLYDAVGIETPKKATKKKEEPVVYKGISADDINAGIPGGGVDPRNAAAYLDSSNPQLAEAARKILIAQTSGEMQLDGKPASTSLTRREAGAKQEQASNAAQVKSTEDAALAKKKKANQEAAQKGYQAPYPDLEKNSKPVKTTTPTTPITGGYSGIPSSKIQATYTGPKQSAAASNAALGLSSAQMAAATPAATALKPTAAVSATGGTGGGGVTPKIPAKTKQQLEADALTAAADLSLPETLFKHIPSLAALLKKYSDPKIGMTNNQFLKELRDDPWYKQNSAEIKARYIQKYNYDDLVATGQATGSSDYEKQIATLEASLKKRADAMGSAAASDPAALRRVAENMYITNQGIDDAMTTDFLAAAIKPMGGMIGGKGTLGYSGQALQNYQTLQAAAKANGFQVSDIIPGGQNEQQVLAGIATGAIDVNRIAQDARKLAAQGQPQYVRELLGQGYNLDQVYAPYRQTMANILEVGDPNQIDLNDPTLRMAITDKGDMNLFDFKKALRQDQRWQYTDQARQDVTGTALNVLRDFGFQG